MWYVRGRGEVYAKFWCGNLRERGHLEDPDVDGGDNIKMGFQEVGCGPWTGSIWLRIRTNGGQL
jgi:hypothetical protein